MAINPYTGEDDGTDNPIQPIVGPSPTPQASGGGFLDNPADRAALLQIGLGLMQPLAFGQTVGGHIGQAVGAGGEAASRGEAEDLKRQQAEAKLAIADERLRIAQQNADTRERRGLGGAIKGMTAWQQLQAARQGQTDAAKASAAADKELADKAEYYDKRANDPLTPDTHPLKKKYGGKDMYEIKQMLKQEAQGGGGGGQYGPPGTKLRQGGKTYTVGPDGNPVED